MREQVVLQLGDRDVTFKRPTDSQWAALVKYSEIVRRNPERTLQGIARMLEVIDNMVVEPDDRLYLEDLMVAGTLDMAELVRVIEKFDEEAAKPAKKAPARARRVR